MTVAATSDAPKVAKTKAPAAPALHPPYLAMVKAALKAVDDKKGASKAAVLKYIVSNYKVGDNFKKINTGINLALKRGVKTGSLKQTKGVGASGSFKIGEKKQAAATKKVSKAPAKEKSAAAKKPKPAAPKKDAAAKAKSTDAKKAKPPKAKKPATPKKAATPKKVAAKKASKAIKKKPAAPKPKKAAAKKAE